MTVLQPGSTTIVLNSPNPSSVGQDVTFTATVSPAFASGTPSGNVTFTANGVPTQVALDAVGVASLTTNALPAGTFTVTADYGGDPVFLPSSTSVTQTVNKNATTTVVISSLSPSFVGDSVTFTATVSPFPVGGTVDFSIDGLPVATAVPLDAVGSAQYTTSLLAAGNHTIVADFLGDAAYQASTGSVSQLVVKTATTTALVSSLNPSIVGGNVTFTATVSPSTATGNVAFNVDGVVTNVTLLAGSAALSTSTLTVGAHAVSAAYGGDAAFLGSVASLTQTVGPVLRATNTVVTSNRNPTANFGQSITFTATVRPVTGTGIPGGTVQFNIDGTNVGGVLTLNAQGRATYTTNTLSAGPHNVIATYSGSAIFAGGGSATFIQNVLPAATTLVMTKTPTGSSVFGQSVTFTARVTANAATGSVQFTLDGVAVGAPVTPDATGRARFITNTLSVSTHTMSAVFTGTGNYLSSTSNLLSHVVNKANSRTVVTTSGTPAPRNTTVVFTATVTAVAPGVGIPAGTVQFRDGGVNMGSPVALNSSGQAAFPTSTLSVGLHQISAVYSGDGNFNTSTSANRSQRIL